MVCILWIIYVSGLFARIGEKLQNPSCQIQYAEKLPWLMVYYDSSSCYLFDSSHKKQCTVFNDRDIFAGATFLDAKHGWGLFYKRMDSDSESGLFLYTPFATTDYLIQLSKYPLHCSYRAAATFTSSLHSPDYPDCLIFVVVARYNIRSCKPGDTDWSMVLTFNGPKQPCRNS